MFQEKLAAFAKLWAAVKEVKFEPEFNENFFPHAMRDPLGRENYFLYCFDLEKQPDSVAKYSTATITPTML